MPIESLDTTIHDRARFKCGVEEVDRYFQAVARRAADNYVAQTYVLAPARPRAEPCEVIGYYTLVPHMYRDAEMAQTTAKALKVKKLGAIPMLLLGQLGVAIEHQGRNVGTYLLRDALRRALYVSLSAGGVAVVTDPINKRAAEFYMRRGFEPLPSQEPRLIVPTRKLAKHNPDIVASFKSKPQPIELTFGSQQFQA